MINRRKKIRVSSRGFTRMAGRFYRIQKHKIDESKHYLNRLSRLIIRKDG